MNALLNTVWPILIGAVVAGISALVKSVYERRDARLVAQRHLELASNRTRFVKEWLAVSKDLDDPDYARAAAVRARTELERAYSEAQQALDHGQSALDQRSDRTYVDQLQQVLLLGRRTRPVAYAVVVAFYVLVVSMWGGLLDDASFDTTSPDSITRTQYVAFAVVATLVLRAVAEVVIRLLERAPRATPDPGTIGAISATERA